MEHHPEFSTTPFFPLRARQDQSTAAPTARLRDAILSVPVGEKNRHGAPESPGNLSAAGSQAGSPGLADSQGFQCRIAPHSPCQGSTDPHRVRGGLQHPAPQAASHTPTPTPPSTVLGTRPHTELLWVFTNSGSSLWSYTLTTYVIDPKMVPPVQSKREQAGQLERTLSSFSFGSPGLSSTLLGGLAGLLCSF